MLIVKMVDGTEYESNWDQLQELITASKRAYSVNLETKDSGTVEIEGENIKTIELIMQI